MKKSRLFSAIATALLFSAPAAWAESHMHGHTNPGMNMTDSDRQMQMGKMQENMIQMHEQMHKIQDANNPQERERLMKEQLKMMQDRMSMMQGMKGDCGRGGPASKGGSMDGMK